MTRLMGRIDILVSLRKSLRRYIAGRTALAQDLNQEDPRTGCRCHERKDATRDDPVHTTGMAKNERNPCNAERKRGALAQEHSMGQPPPWIFSTQFTDLKNHSHEPQCGADGKELAP